MKQVDSASDNIVYAKSLNDELYGDLNHEARPEGFIRTFTRLEEITDDKEDQMVWIRARCHEVRAKSSKLVFMVLRYQTDTIQCVLSAGTCPEKLAVNKYAQHIPTESLVDVYGKLTKPKTPIESCTISLEMKVEKIFCFSRCTANVPFLIRDANRSDCEKKEGTVVDVSLETRLDNRVIDIRTISMQCVLRVTSQVCFLFREFLLNNRFIEIHSPKLLGGSSEGGANVFTLKYFDRPACLAQSPQLFKQMAICGDLDRVFEIAPVFRAENSNTHRHLCEFTGLDFEMAIVNDYSEVLNMICRLFLYICKHLPVRCAKELEQLRQLYPSEPFVPQIEGAAEDEVLNMTFKEACNMLRKAGYDVPEDVSGFDFSTEQEKALGALVKKQYKTDFYYITEYPTAVRAFYSMPKSNEPELSYSYDFFMRGEEILSGAQRIHTPELLTQQAIKKGLDPATIADYIKSFCYGSFMHGGCGIGLERVVMLFCNIPNIRRISMFPRDPKRIAP